MIAKTIACFAGNFDRAIPGCIDGSALWCRKIESFMHLGRSVNRVYPHAKARSDSVKVPIADGLDSRNACQLFTLVFYKMFNLVITGKLVIDPGPDVGQCFSQLLSQVFII